MEDVIALFLTQEGVQDENDAKAIIGAFLNVLSQSKNLGDGVEMPKDVLEKMPGSADIMKKYQRGEFTKSVAKQGTNMAVSSLLLPRPPGVPPGPPPPVVLYQAGKAVHKALRKDKDAGNTKDCIVSLSKSRQIEQEHLVALIPLFADYVTEKTSVVTVREILRMPQDKDMEDDSRR